MNLNIGAGKTFIPGFVNIDISDRADISLDLNRECLPFDDDSVDLVFSKHTFEHFDNYLHAIAEIHRVMKHGAELLVSVPYVTSTEYNLVNPYHKQHFNEFSFDFFDPQRLLGSAAENDAVKFRKIIHRFHYTPEFVNEPPKKREWCRRHYFNVVKQIVFGVMAIKDTDQPLPVETDTPQRLLRQYDEWDASRVSYDEAGKNSGG